MSPEEIAERRERRARRDYLAAAAMSGLVANPDQQTTDASSERIAKWSVAYADALLAELDK